MQLLQHFKELTIRPKNTEELKGLILQLAIQGKLTANWREENPDVEPASELLNRIQEEKEQLIKEKKLKKEKLLPPIQKNGKPYDLAENWIWCRLQDIIKISSGKGLTAAKMFKTGKIPVYGGNGITGYHNLGNVVKPTIVIGRVGFYCGSIHLTESVAWVTDNAFITYYSENNIFRDFLFLLLRGTNLKENENATAQPVISGRKVYPIVVSLPPLEEQKEIVKVVETLFKEVEQLEQLTVKRINLKEDFVTSALNQLTTNNANQEWRLLQEHFKSFFNETTNIKKLRETVLQLAVQGKLTADWRANNPDTEDASVLLKRIQEEKTQLIKDKKIKKEKALPLITKDEIPYELPEGWVWCRFGDLITFLNGYAFKSSTYVSTSAYQIIRLGNVKNDNFIVNAKEAYVPSAVGEVTLDYQLFEDDILTTLTGTKNRRDYCFTCLVKQEHLEEKVLLLNQRVGCIRAIDKSASELFNKFLKSDIILNQLFETETGTANQGNIGSTAFKNLVFPLPPIEEQSAIIKKVNALMGLCDSLEQEVKQSQEHSEQLMQSCLREVFASKKTKDELISSLLPELDALQKVANLQQAMIVQKTEIGLGSGRGKVYLQKTSANLKNIKKAPIGYTFEKSHHGEFSWQLSEDLDKNPYLHKVTTDYGEIYEVNANKQQDVLNALNSPENYSFVQSIDELIEVYKNKLINGTTDRVELLNTVCKAITDTQSIIGNTVYAYMQDWEIKQNDFKSKADKFTQSETFAMIQLVTQLEWDKQILK